MLLRVCSLAAAEKLGRVSFVTHSFGALIARVALGLPELADLLPKLHTYAL